jgi:acyl-CoA thioester hydrolase
MKFIYKYRIKWQEVDPMYFVRTEEYLDYYREASSELMRSVGYPYRKLEEEKLQFPIIEVHAKYLKPLRYDEQITIETWISKLKSFQIVVQYKILKDTGEEAANAKIIYGVLTKESEELSPMPDELKTKLEGFVEKES